MPSRHRLLGPALAGLLVLPLVAAAPTGTSLGVDELLAGLPEGITTAAQLPDELLDLLPGSAAEAGLAYAPRLVEVTVPTRADRNRVVATGLDVTEHAGDDHLAVVLHDPAQEATLRSLGLPVETVTADLVAREHERIMADAAFHRANAVTDLPSGRTTYRVLADFGAEIDQLAADNPRLVKRISVGESIEGRDLTGIEIGVGVQESEDGRPVMLMFGNHHAREWPSAETPMEFAHTLVQDFDAADARTVDLLTRSRVIIVPVSNPDGFDASRTSGDLIDLNIVDGGGTVSILATPGNAYKRKNCRITEQFDQPAGCLAIPSPGGYGIGIDLNRNYGALWGGPGTSDMTPFPTYRGPAPFSEPETQAIRTLISTRQVTTLISNHTFGNLLLRPVGVEPSTIHPDGLPVGFAPDECFPTDGGRDDGMQALGERMTAQTGYSNQFGWELYDTTGTTEDYSYNATGGYGYTFEIGPDEFHPPFEEVVAEYTGTSDAAQGVTVDTADDLTSAAARDCGDTIDAATVGGGLREAYYLALENAANASTHAVLSGEGPVGAEIGVTRTGTFPLWDGTPFEDTVTTSMVVGEDGTFDYHVNPSTRPFVDSRPYAAPDDTPVEVTVTGEETRTGSTPDTEDVPVDVPAGTDSLVVELTAGAPDDYDIELISPDLVVLDTSSQPTTDERVEHTLPNGIQPGEYVVRITNYTEDETGLPVAASDWQMDITLGTVPDSAEDGLLFTPGEAESWTVTCTVDEEVVASRDVVVDRGEVRDLGAVCGRVSGSPTVPTVPVTPPAPDVEGPSADGSTRRLAGPTRYDTAVAVSRARFPAAGSADVVVLSRGDDPDGFADALAGGPLAIDLDGPLLVTEPGRLREEVAAEIDRVLADDGEVVLLGGEQALSPAVAEALVAAGHATDRVAGGTRYDTAVAIAERLGDPDLVLLATGTTFADALAASAAAGARQGAVLLTTPDTPHPTTAAYLDEHDPSQVLAVGGPAARAFPAMEAVTGPDRVATAVVLAERLLPDATVAGLARSDAFPDALAGAAYVGARGGPVLLTPTATLDDRVADHLCGGAVDELVVLGGTVAITESVERAAAALMARGGC